MTFFAQLRKFGSYWQQDPLAREIFFFCLVGGIGFIVDFTAFVSAQNVMSDVPARCTALAVGIFVTWQLNRHLTFRSGDPKWIRELGRFTATRLVGSAMNAGVSLSVLWEFPQAGRLVALMCGTAVALLFNYFSAKLWAYQKPI